MSGNLSDLIDVFSGSLEPLEDPSKDLHATLRVVCLLCSLVFVASSLILNLTLIINILCTGKTSVPYFRLLILYAIFHFIFQLSDVYLDSREILRAWLQESEGLVWLENCVPVLSRASLGILFLLVSTLTIERFLSSSVGGVVSTCLQLISALLALSLPALLAAFQILSSQRISSSFSLDSEVWFALEVGTYIILPLLILTIFGTVNYCKISMSSRLMPTYEISAVKTNIGLVVLSNIVVFIFLIEECLILWLTQLNTRQNIDEPVKEMVELVSVTLLCVRMGLNLIQSLIPVFILSICCSCCTWCCCPAINQLEETRYKPVSRNAENVSL